MAVQRQAAETYQLWQRNPRHPSLHFKPIDPADRDTHSIRIGAHYRAIGKWQPDGSFLWGWIGSHEEYNKLI